MRSLIVNNNDFFRVGTQLYQVQSVSSSDPTQLVLTQPFTGGYSDITQAYYVPFPALGLLSYTATSADVDAYLEAQMTSLYPLYIDNFEVARQTLAVGTTVGYSWLVTFTGEMFSGEVGQCRINIPPLSITSTLVYFSPFSYISPPSHIFPRSHLPSLSPLSLSPLSLPSLSPLVPSLLSLSPPLFPPPLLSLSPLLLSR